jgi:hypothetical protein
MTPSEPSEPDEDSDSDNNSDGTDPLTLLASEDIPERSPKPTTTTTTTASRKRRHTFSSSNAAPPVWPATPLSVRRKVVQEKWDLSRLDTFVWVAVDKNGRLAIREGEEGGVGDEMWWPAKVRVLCFRGFYFYLFHDDFFFEDTKQNDDC